MHSPLQIQFALAFYASPDPEGIIGEAVYDSEAGREAKEWLYYEGLVDRDARPWPQTTPRLEAFVQHLLRQPLPECHWIVPTARQSDAEGEE